MLTIGSISKLICSGLRVGWVRAPEPVIQRLARVKSAMDLGCPPLTQAIAAQLLGVVGEARNLRRLQLKPRRDLLVSAAAPAFARVGIPCAFRRDVSLGQAAQRGCP